MPGGKKKGFFGRLRQVPEIRTEEAEGSEDANDGETCRSPTGLEIPEIRADDAGAAIDDLSGGCGGSSPVSPGLGAAAVGVAQGAAVSPATASVFDYESGGSTTSPDSTTVIGRERIVSLDIAGVGPQSPSPSVDRLSVSFSPDLGGDYSMDNMADLSADSKVRFSKDHLSALNPDDEDDDDYSESLDAIIRRRESGRRRSVRRSPKRVSSPFGSDSESGGKGRRRSSTMTSTSCEETQISIEEPEMTEEQIFDSIRLHKELIEQLKKQPWKMKKRLKIARKAKAYVKKHEGELEQRLAQSKNTKDLMARYNLIFLRYWERLKREAVNLAKNLIPWEMRIKMIESHFGSVVASYFVFLRWVFWINIVMSIFISCFVIIPEVLAADRATVDDRKDLLPDEESTAFNLQTLWDFEGFLKYSPLFYGYYTNKDKTREGYRLPFAYFMTLLGMYAYSFASILRRMAENTRLSRLSDKDEDCTFTWKLFTGWDYMIGHSETADNKVASLIMGFKENILEEREKKKEERNWKIIALKVLANILIMGLLASSAYAVVVVVDRSQEPEADDSWWRQNEVTVIVSMISIVFPNIFELVGMMEHNHPRTQLQWQLARIMLLYLLNLYALIFALFKKVDAMTATLEVFRPNTTLAPSTTMMTPASTFPTENWISPFNSTQKDEFAIYGDVLSAVFDDLGLSFLSNQIWPLNISCFAVRIYCDTKEPIKFMNFSTTPMPYVTTTTTTSHPQWDYDEDEVPSLKGMMEASFLSLTPTPISNLSEMMSGNLSLPKLVNQTIAHVLPVLLSKSNLSLMTKSLPIPEIEISKAEPLSSGGELYPTSLSPWQEDRIDKRLSTITPSYKRNDNKRGRHRNRISRHSSTPGPPSARERGTTARPIAPLPYMTPTDEGPLRFTREVHSGLHIDNGTDWSSTSWSAGANDAISNKNYKSSTMPVWLWNDTDFLNDSPYSTVNPSYAESYDEYLTIEDDYCIAIKCLNIALTSSNITIYTYEDHLINGSGWLIEYSTTQSADLPDTSTSYVQSSTEKSPHELNGTKATPSDQGMNITARKLRALCWETMFGQEMVKLTIMDLVMTTISILITDFFRALFVRVMNHCWFWDLEKQFPGYGDFKIAENILHLVNNQGMIWMGMFFSPGIPGLNMLKLVILMYVRSWAVLTCNIPHETVFKASNSSNFYYTLLLTMLFLCTLPVGYAIVWLPPSWHCGPFSQYSKIYQIFTSSLEAILPQTVSRGLDYVASPGIIIPLLVLLILVIYYLNSVVNSLREANKDLKDQLRRERTEERRKVFQMADARHDPPNSSSKWIVMKKILPVLPSKVKVLQAATQQLKHQANLHELRPIEKEDDKKTKKQISEDDNSEAVLANAFKANSVKLPKEVTGIHKTTQDGTKENGKVTRKSENEMNQEKKEKNVVNNDDSESKNPPSREKPEEKQPTADEAPA